MTKEEFQTLRSELHQSGKSLKIYLHDAGVSYSTYNYSHKWKLEHPEAIIKKEQ